MADEESLVKRIDEVYNCPCSGGRFFFQASEIKASFEQRRK